MPETLHVSGEKERLLQSLDKVGGMPPLRLPNYGIPWDGSTLHLQPRGPGAWPTVDFSLVPVLHGLSSFVMGVLGLLLLFSPLFRSNLAFL